MQHRVIPIFNAWRWVPGVGLTGSEGIPGGVTRATFDPPGWKCERCSEPRKDHLAFRSSRMQMVLACPNDWIIWHDELGIFVNRSGLSGWAIKYEPKGDTLSPVAEFVLPYG